MHGALRRTPGLASFLAEARPISAIFQNHRNSATLLGAISYDH
jgi:hypothetical protein